MANVNVLQNHVWPLLLHILTSKFAKNIGLCRKTCVKRPLSKRLKIGFQYQLMLNVCQKYCRMLQGEHSAILSTFIKPPFIIQNFVLSIMSGRFTQVLLYFVIISQFTYSHYPSSRVNHNIGVMNVSTNIQFSGQEHIYINYQICALKAGELIYDFHYLQVPEGH